MTIKFMLGYLLLFSLYNDYSKYARVYFSVSLDRGYSIYVRVYFSVFTG